MRDEKTCAILLAMGGPDNTHNVRRYLFNIFSDRSIIRLPGGPFLQKPLAWFISSARKGKVASHYAMIGGGSPLFAWTDAQRRRVEELLRSELPGFRCFVGMRYFEPTIGEAVHRAFHEGFRRLIFIPMYPQYSRATTGSSFEEAGRQLAGYRGITSVFVRDYHDNPMYISLLRDFIDANIRPGETLLFSAHSLPEKFVQDGDPYVEQIKRSAKLTAGGRDFHVAFQSRTGPVRWVQPETVSEVRRLLSSRPGGLFIVPISFVCDHIETLYELDIELREMVGPALAPRIRRMPMFNDDHRFAQVLANLIRERVSARVTH
ncbi:MAG: ferrochelatase [Candidatus Zixiibacteriota bacterium]